MRGCGCSRHQSPDITTTELQSPTCTMRRIVSREKILSVHGRRRSNDGDAVDDTSRNRKENQGSNQNDCAVSEESNNCRNVGSVVDTARTTRVKGRSKIGRFLGSIRRASADIPPEADALARAVQSARSASSRAFATEEKTQAKGTRNITREKLTTITSQKSLKFNRTFRSSSRGTNESFNEHDEERISEKDDDGSIQMDELRPRRTSMARRECINAMDLQMGLDSDSANFLDMVLKAKGRDWLKSLSRRDPRACIKTFFDDIALDGADTIEDPGQGFHPELASPLLAMFQRSSVFSVWRPTSVDSIHKMMTGQGTGKGLDIKGKSAKKGKLSAYVPFIQIHDEKHKSKIRILPKDGRLRIFYKKQDARNNAHEILLSVLNDMVAQTAMARMGILESKHENIDPAQDQDLVVRLTVFRKRDDLSEEDEERLAILDKWEMDNPSIITIDDYAPKCYGLDVPKRLFWEAYVMRADDITRVPDSTFDTGRPSRPSFQDMNFSSIKNEWKEDTPRAVVWQYTDPYSPPSEPDPDPMLPQTLLMAYEENGRVLPVVSDFDCFLLGTRGIRFRNPLPEEQVALLHEMVDDTEKILEGNLEGKCTNWTSSWLDTMKHKTVHHPMPKYGFGDPKSYAIMRHAVKRLQEFGAVRHGAECFNYYFPQELDDEFLVIGGDIEGGGTYKYMKLSELQDFLLGRIDQGFTFPLNPKWVLCDNGWQAIWDKLTTSSHPNVELSINAWFPPESRLRERIKDIRQKYPKGFQITDDFNNKKQGTGGWDEAEAALESYHRIQRAKRKLWVVLCWISIVQKSQKTVRDRKEGHSDKEKQFMHSDEKKEEKQSVVGDGDVTKPSVVQLVNNVEGGQSDINSGYDGDSTKLPDNYIISTSNTEDTDRPRVSFNEEVGSGLESKNEMKEKGNHIVDTLELKPRAKRLSIGDDSSIDSSYSRSTSLMNSEEKHIEVIDSLLKSKDLCLSKSQSLGLQQIRDLLQASKPHKRRHTAFAGSFCFDDTDIPLFIRKEYGGEIKSIKPSFKAQVKKLIIAQRMLSINVPCVEPAIEDRRFLPDEWSRLSREARERLAKKLSFEGLASWDFNVIDFSEECDGCPLLLLGWAILGSPHAQQAMASDIGLEKKAEESGYNFVTSFVLKIPVLCNFLRRIESNYLPNPYHNKTHAADVLQTLNTMLQFGGVKFAPSSLEIFCILIAAIVHDVKHPGKNNNFQVNSRSELAVEYNDVSVLENMSVSWFFSQLTGSKRDPTVDILAGLTADQFLKARSLLIKSVLETDMTHHFSLLKKIKIHQTKFKGKEAKEWLEPYSCDGLNLEPSTDMLCFLLHQADISNPAKPYPLFVKWADCVMKECYEQGDKESAMSLPISPLCDRANTDLKQSQVGFIKFVVKPSCEMLGEIIPKFAEVVLPHLKNNLTYWDNYEDVKKEKNTTC